MKTLTNQLKKKGFALISIISVVVLLALIAVALLTLGMLNTRSQGIAKDDEQAKDNAKLALAEAIGALQENLGPDTRISYPADVLDVDNNKNLTAVSRSWEGLTQDTDGRPLIPPYDTKGVLYNEATPQSGRFLQYLLPDISGMDLTNSASPPDITNGAITLLGSGTFNFSAMLR